MSRIGKKPVVLPKGVTATLNGNTITVQGPKGTLSFAASDHVDLALADGVVVVRPRGESKQARASWGTTRALVANMVTGVSQGFRKELELVGVGYRAAMQGKTLQLTVGFSHDVTFAPPAGITITTPKPTEIVIEGVDKQTVGQVAAEIRAVRPPEPYNLKGIRYRGEFIFKKEGKRK